MKTAADMNTFVVTRTTKDGEKQTFKAYAFTADGAKLLGSVGGHTVHDVKEA